MDKKMKQRWKNKRFQRKRKLSQIGLSWLKEDSRNSLELTKNRLTSHLVNQNLQKVQKW